MCSERAGLYYESLPAKKPLVACARHVARVRQACYSPSTPEPFNERDWPNSTHCADNREGSFVDVRGLIRMGLRLYCNRYAHFKHPLVCSVNCPYRTRCQDFALFYDENRAEVDSLVEDYFAARAGHERESERQFLPTAAPVSLRTLIRLEVKREMTESRYIWIGKDDQAELLDLEEVIRRAERGSKAKHIYKIAQEMELRFQLVPLKRIEKARRSAQADSERAAARRRGSRPRPVPAESPAPLKPVPVIETAPQPRRTRARAAKVAGDR